MSVVSELRTLAIGLDELADWHDIKRDSDHTQIAVGIRTAAQTARLRALQAEKSIECRTDERPRFAVLRAPQRPSGMSWPELVDVVVGPSCSPEEMLRRVARAAERLSDFATPEPPAIQPPAELMTHRAVEPFTCAGCALKGFWRRGVLTPPLGAEPPPRFCHNCKSKGNHEWKTRI